MLICLASMVLLPCTCCEFLMVLKIPFDSKFGYRIYRLSLILLLRATDEFTFFTCLRLLRCLFWAFTLLRTVSPLPKMFA